MICLGARCLWSEVSVIQMKESVSFVSQKMTNLLADIFSYTVEDMVRLPYIVSYFDYMLYVQYIVDKELTVQV